MRTNPSVTYLRVPDTVTKPCRENSCWNGRPTTWGRNNRTWVIVIIPIVLRICCGEDRHENGKKVLCSYLVITLKHIPWKLRPRRPSSHVRTCEPSKSSWRGGDAPGRRGCPWLDASGNYLAAAKIRQSAPCRITKLLKWLQNSPSPPKRKFRLFRR